MLAIAGFLFLFAVLILVVLVGWAVMAYLRAGVKAAEEGIDRDQDSRDAGHV